MDLVDTLLLDIIKFQYAYHLDSPEVKVTDLEISCYKSISNM